MSKQQINQYYNQLAKLIQHGGSRNETAVRRAFETLLNSYAEPKHLLLVPELRVKGTLGKDVQPDGVLKNAMRLDFGLWESKDEKDTIDTEIEAKRQKGYPFTNILFEDTDTAVLFQENQEVMRVSMKDADRLHEILTRFIGFEPLQIKEFIQALDKFKEDVPDIVANLRDLIDTEAQTNTDYRAARDNFFALCQAEINPDITPEDIREMIIQHILTADIFNAVFGDSEFHRENNIARELEHVIETFMTRAVRKNHLSHINHYYQLIRDSAAGIADHHEKQKFLKVIYENFYKVYNPKGADRLGVVYTPNEIVRFMIESTDYLLEKHFGKNLHDKNVEILDPATGTGTFITDLIDYIAPQYLEYKYKNEIHANEVAILPYYIANLNIEYTYQQKMQRYEEFPNICFVDTLDNTQALDYKGKQFDMFGLSSENAERIKRQNERKISVIIGNPPYNAKQANYNYQNSNRAYKYIDKRIKDTYIKEGTAQNQIVVYDMFTRFYRWAMDRIDQNGVVAFITNRSFIDSRAFDGFRKCVEDDFDSIYIVDTKSDVRANPKIAGTSHNVFGIQTGVAIAFLIKRKDDAPSDKKCNIQFIQLDDFWRKEAKLNWLRENKINSIGFERIEPDAKHNWIDQTNNDWDSLLPLIDKDVKAGKSKEAIFKTFSYGFDTKRDEYLFDFNLNTLISKVEFFTSEYNSTVKNPKYDNKFVIKWSRNLENEAKRGKLVSFAKESIVSSDYRPFVDKNLYWDSVLISETFLWQRIFKKDEPNVYLAISGPAHSKPFQALTTSKPHCGDYLEKTQSIPLYSWDSSNDDQNNITDWGLEQFQAHYGNSKISKLDIFHYVYTVLHHPAYRNKYELNLKREFPRIPFYDDFHKWAAWGKELMRLHIDYEEIEPYALKRKDLKTKPIQQGLLDDTVSKAPKLAPKTKLAADKDAGAIIVDSVTTLEGVPPEAWEYKLGNRSALEWILDQYKERKPKDPTIAEKFDTYRFADHKEHVIDLLARVCTVSVKTMEIIKQMPK